MAKEYTEKEILSKVEDFMLDKIAEWESVKASRCEIGKSKNTVTCLIKIKDLKTNEMHSKVMAFSFEQIGIS